MVMFNVFNAMKLLLAEEECFKVDILEGAAHSEIEQSLKNDVLERALTGDSDLEDMEEEEQINS